MQVRYYNRWGGGPSVRLSWQPAGASSAAVLASSAVAAVWPAFPTAVGPSTAVSRKLPVASGARYWLKVSCAAPTSGACGPSYHPFGLTPFATIPCR